MGKLHNADEADSLRANAAQRIKVVYANITELLMDILEVHESVFGGHVAPKKDDARPDSLKAALDNHRDVSSMQSWLKSKPAFVRAVFHLTGPGYVRNVSHEVRDHVSDLKIFYEDALSELAVIARMEKSIQKFRAGEERHFDDLRRSYRRRNSSIELSDPASPTEDEAKALKHLPSLL